MPHVPFFRKEKPQTGVVTEHRSEREGKENFGLLAAADELITAIEARDRKGVARAISNAFDLLDSLPHEEGPHVEGAE